MIQDITIRTAPEFTSERYVCRSYYDNGMLKDCTCGRCARPGRKVPISYFINVTDKSEHVKATLFAVTAYWLDRPVVIRRIQFIDQRDI